MLTKDDEINTEMSDKDLRSFGLIMAGMILLFFAVLIPWIWSFALPTWPFIAATFFAAMGLLFPKGLKPIYQVWMKIGAVLGFINTRIILGLVFFAVILPFGLVMRIFSDPMNKKLDATSKTYRINSKEPAKESLRNPY